MLAPVGGWQTQGEIERLDGEPDVMVDDPLLHAGGQAARNDGAGQSPYFQTYTAHVGEAPIAQRFAQGKGDGAIVALDVTSLARGRGDHMDQFGSCSHWASTW